MRITACFGAALVVLALVAAAPAAGAATPKSLTAAESYAPASVVDWTDFEYTAVSQVAARLGVSLRNGSAAQQDIAFSKAQQKSGEAWFDPAPITAGLWHVADLDWNFFATTSGSEPVEGFGMRPGLSLTAIRRMLATCGYARRSVAGATVLSAQGTGFLQCGKGGALQPQFAILAAAHVVLMSPSASALAAAIRHRDTLSSSPIARRLTAGVGGAPSIVLASGPGYCRALTVSLTDVLGASQESVRQELAAHPAGAPSLGLAFGVRLAPKAASASLVVAYADARTASTDTPRMANAIRTEASVASKQPYTTLLKVGTTSVKGSDGVIALTAPKLPFELEQMWEANDLAFARC